MRCFTTGRLEAYERMMQDTGEGNRRYYVGSANAGRTFNGERDKPVQNEAVKAGDDHARNQS